MKHVILLLAVMFFLPLAPIPAQAQDNFEVSPKLEKWIKKQARIMSDKAEKFGFTARQESGKEMSADALKACQAALDVCTAKTAACTACIESWTGGFGAFCQQECGEAAGACEAASKACAAASGG